LWRRLAHLARRHISFVAPPAEPSPDELWSDACRLLAWHNKGSDSCIQTLNRLWRKSPWVQQETVLPTLESGRVSTSEEFWPLDRLVALLHDKQRTSKTPRSVEPLVIVVRWAGQDYLIDGRTRINHWQRVGTPGPIRVLVIAETPSHGAQ
jgi:hypothetical protein